MKTSTADANRERERWYECFARFSTVTKFNCRPRGWPIEAHSSSTKRRASTKMNDSWPEIIRDAKPEWRNRARRVGFHCDTVRGSRYCFSASSSRFPLFFTRREMVVKRRFPQELFLTACSFVGCSQSLKIADPLPAVNGKIRGRSRGISRAILRKRGRRDFDRYSFQFEILGGGIRATSETSPVIGKFVGREREREACNLQIRSNFAP